VIWNITELENKKSTHFFVTWLPFCKFWKTKELKPLFHQKNFFIPGFVDALIHTHYNLSVTFIFECDPP